MPEIAKSGVKIAPYVGRVRIDWDQVFDGRMWTFHKGADYTTEDEAFRKKVVLAAQKHKVAVGFGENEPEGQVTVQAIL